MLQVTCVEYGVCAIVGTGGALFGYGMCRLQQICTADHHRPCTLKHAPPPLIVRPCPAWGEHNADIGVISGVLAMPSFTSAFNVSSWTDSPAHLAEEGAVVSTFIFGNLVGALVSSFIADKWGRRATMFIACTVFLVGGALQVAAFTMWALYAGRAIAGLAIGLMTMIVPLFNAELAPASLRGRLITFNQIAMTGGIAVSYWVNYGLQDIPQGWRFALGGQLVFAVVLMVGLAFVPQSPRWLVMVGDHEGAYQSLVRLRCDERVAKRELRAMQELRACEDAQAVDSWGTLCCDATSRRRLLLCAMLQSFQQLTVCACIHACVRKIHARSAPCCAWGWRGTASERASEHTNGCLEWRQIHRINSRWIGRQPHHCAETARGVCTRLKPAAAFASCSS